MARGRRGGASPSRSGGSMFGNRSSPSQSRTSSSVPARHAALPPAIAQNPSGGGMMSGIGSTIAQGMAFGTGSAVAHRAVGAVAGGFGGSGERPSEERMDERSVQHVNPVLQGPCAQDKQMFFECLQTNQGDQKSCSFLYDALQTCQRNESQMSFQ